MNRGLMLKAAYEIAPTTLICGGLLLALEALLAYVIPGLQGEYSEAMLQVEFVRTMMQAMLGTEVGEELGAETFMSLPWVHPVVLALVWSHVVICCTRVPAGEVDRGTIDILLGMPVTRWEVLRSETVVWLAGGMVVMVLALAGNTLGSWILAEQSAPSISRTAMVVVNLFCFYLAAGGLAWLISAVSDRRGRAVTVVVMLLLASFFLNYLAQFWEPAEKIAFLGILDYYRPLLIMRDGVWPIKDMAVLLAVAVVLWTAAGVLFARRDVSTV